MLQKRDERNYALPCSYKIYLPGEQFIGSDFADEPEFNPLPIEFSKIEQEDFIHADFEETIAENDRWDYIAAAASGMLTATLNELLGNKISLIDARKWGEKETNRFVIHAAGMVGYKGNDLSSAIRMLEKLFPVPSDTLTPEFGGGLQHHLRDFAHHPTIVGLAFSILSQFTGKGYGTNTEGKFVFFDFKTEEYVGKNICEKLFFGTIIWAFHLISDMAGSNQNAGKGTGIPGPILSLFKELSVLPLMKNLKAQYNGKELPFSVLISKIFNGTYFKEIVDDKAFRFDLRTEMGAAYQLCKESIPVIANECIVRAIYSIRRLYRELKVHDVCALEDIKKLNPEHFLPIKNRELDHMLTIASGTFVVITTGTAAVQAVLKNKANRQKAVSDFILAINFPGLGRFIFALHAEMKYVIHDLEKLMREYHNRQKELEKAAVHFNVLEFLSLTESQAKILLSLKHQKVIDDIAHTKKEKAKHLKEDWLTNWKDENVKRLKTTESELFFTDDELIKQKLDEELRKETGIRWLYLIGMELSLFQPYFDLGGEKTYKGLSCRDAYVKEKFCCLQNVVTYEDMKKMDKQYRKSIAVLKNQTQKMIVGVSASVAAGVATGGLAWAFAPKIAVLIAGHSFVGIYGAALTNASLAYLGGGALAIGGLGMAGGTAVVTGGGTLLGLLGTGAISLSTLAVLSSKAYVLNECAKLMTFCECVLIEKMHDTESVSEIQNGIFKLTDELKFEIEKNDTKTSNKEEKEKYKAQKESLVLLERCRSAIEQIRI